MKRHCRVENNLILWEETWIRLQKLLLLVSVSDTCLYNSGKSVRHARVEWNLRNISNQTFSFIGEELTSKTLYIEHRIKWRFPDS